MRIFSLIHIPFEDTGYIKLYAEKKDHVLSETHLYRGESLPELSLFDLLIIMGGPMNVNEEEKYPFLKEEKRFIRSCIDSGKKVLGICLGAQLIASVLGAGVRRNKCREIGWFDVEKTADACMSPVLKKFPEKFRVFHWHGDTFDIPPGCIRILKSECCENQGFLCGDKVIALQCHPEVTAETISQLSKNCSDELLEKGRFVQELSEILDESYIPAANKVAWDILDYLTEV